MFVESVECACIKENDDKVRCFFKFCNKLFKTVDFLKKHIALKHEFYLQDISLSVIEPSMRDRYEAEDYMTRPLPPVECQVLDGIERRSVLDILQNHGPKLLQVPVFPHNRFESGHFDRFGTHGGRSGGG